MVLTCTRGVSIDEALVLLAHGVVSSETAPWAVVQAWENCGDTTPPPPAGLLCLFEGHNELAPRFGYVLVFDVPESEVRWRGVGRYHFSPPCDCCPGFTLHASELGVERLELGWLRGVDPALLDAIEQEMAPWAGWERWRSFSEEELLGFLRSTVFVDRRAPESLPALAKFWNMYWDGDLAPWFSTGQLGRHGTTALL